MKLVITDNLSSTDKYSDILDFDWLHEALSLTVAMVIVSDDKFHEIPPPPDLSKE